MDKLIEDLKTVRCDAYRGAVVIATHDTRGIGAETARAMAIARTHLETAAMWLDHARMCAEDVREATGG